MVVSVCVHVCVCVSIGLSGKCIAAKRLIGLGCRLDGVSRRMGVLDGGDIQIIIRGKGQFWG